MRRVPCVGMGEPLAALRRMALLPSEFALSSEEAGHTLTKAPVSIKISEFVNSSTTKNPGCGRIEFTSMKGSAGMTDSELSLTDARPAAMFTRGRRPRFLARASEADARGTQRRICGRRDRTCDGNHRGQMT